MKFSDSQNHTRYSFIRENARRYAQHIPHGYVHLEIVPKPNDTFYDFITNYREGWKCAPRTTVRPDPPLLTQPTEIYLKQVGMIPNYLGHIPGAAFRYGKTFGSDTRDAKSFWLREKIPTIKLTQS